MTKGEHEMNFKIMTKDDQWTMDEPCGEREIIKIWNSKYAGSTAILDLKIMGEDGREYEIVDGRLEEHWANCWY